MNAIAMEVSFGVGYFDSAISVSRLGQSNIWRKVGKSSLPTSNQTLNVLLELLTTLRENTNCFYSQREKVFIIIKIIFKSKNRVLAFKKWVFKIKK